MRKHLIGTILVLAALAACNKEVETPAPAVDNGQEEVTPGKVTKFSIPLMKTGTSGTITYRRSFDGYTVTRTAKIKDTRIRLLIGKVKRSSKKVTVTVTDDDYDGAISAVQGDIIKIKVGKKTYTKKVGSKPKYKYTQKIKKQKKGTRIKVTVYNKFKQIRCTKTIKVKK